MMFRVTAESSPAPTGDGSAVRVALQQAAAFALSEWQRQASAAFKHATGTYTKSVIKTYADSIVVSQVDGNTWDITNVAPYALPLETGVQPFDMKSTITKGKHKVSASGKAYRVIPFRHGGPGAVTLPPMPKDVYAAVKMGAPIPPEYVGTKYEGMVKVGAPRHSQYFTFRVLSEDGTGWEHPGFEAFHLAEKVAEKVKTMLAQTIGAAVVLDIVGGSETGIPFYLA